MQVVKDRVSFRQQIADESLVDFQPEGYKIQVKLRPLSALDRSKVIDKYGVLQKEEESEHKLEAVTVQNQCFIVARGLVNDSGQQLYQDNELEDIAKEVPGKLLDKLSRKILEISGMEKTAETGAEETKNPAPTAEETVQKSEPTSETSSSDSPQNSAGGTSTDS